MENSILTRLGENKPVFELSYVHSVDELNRFMRFNIAERNLIFILPVCLIMVFMGILATIVSEIVWAGIILVICSLLIPFCMLSLSFFMVKKKLYDDKFYIQGISQYKFYDEFIHVRIENKKKTAQSVISYVNLYAIYETATNIYIYINKMTAIIIEKLKIQQLELAEFRKFLRGKLGRLYKNQLGIAYKDKHSDIKKTDNNNFGQ